MLSEEKKFLKFASFLFCLIIKFKNCEILETVLLFQISTLNSTDTKLKDQDVLLIEFY